METCFLRVPVSPAVPAAGALQERRSTGRRKVLAGLSLRQSLTPQSSHTLPLPSLASLTTQISLNGNNNLPTYKIILQIIERNFFTDRSPVVIEDFHHITSRYGRAQQGQ